MLFRKISLRGLQWYIFSLAYPLWYWRDKCLKIFWQGPHLNPVYKCIHYKSMGACDSQIVTFWPCQTSSVVVNWASYRPHPSLPLLQPHNWGVWLASTSKLMTTGTIHYLSDGLETRTALFRGSRTLQNLVVTSLLKDMADHCSCSKQAVLEIMAKIGYSNPGQVAKVKDTIANG